jgi:YYY domain-containing protein
MLTLYGFFYFFVILFLIFVTKTRKLSHADLFVLLLIVLSTLLIILPEFIYVKDIYPAHYRANTMFKLVFQAFIMLSISCAYIIFRLMRPAVSVRSWIRPFSTVVFPFFSVALVSIVLTYPYLAITAYYGNLQTYKTLDGTKYLETLYPGDYAAIQWINKNIKGQPVMLEAQGDSYTDFARVSSNTGLPTVLGWTVHEWLWRGTYDIPAARINVVKDLYESTDEKLTKDLLKKYNVQYVFIGAMENQKHPTLNETKFTKLGTLVFQKDQTKIYKIK